MIFLPVVARELRVAARRPSTYRTRAWAVLLALLVFGWKLLEFAHDNVPPAWQGRPLFLALSGLAFGYCLLIGARVTADCLSEEKREGTLGLLFLTDLKGYDIVLGKLAATSMNAAYGLMAILPLLAVPMQIGGVTLAEFGRMALVLLNTLLFSLAMGILVSAVSRDERKAVFATLVGILAVVFLPGAAVMALQNSYPGAFSSPDPIWRVLFLSPAYAFLWIVMFPAPGPFPEISFVCCLLTTHLLSWLLLAQASRRLRRVWQSEAPRGWWARWLEQVEQWGFGRAEERKRHRARWLDINAFLWLASRDRWKPRYAWLLLGAVGGTWLWSYWDYGRMMFDTDTLVPTVLLLNTFLKVWVASEACARVVADRRAGALELLLSTPLSTEAIIQGQWLALRRQFLKPVVVMVGLEYWALRHTFDRVPVLLVLTMLVLDLITLGWVSLWLGLRAKNTGRAIVNATALVLVLPWLIYGMSVLFLATFPALPGLLSGTGSNAVELELGVKVYLWSIIGLVIDLALGFRWARNRCRRDFRQAAVQPF